MEERGSWTEERRREEEGGDRVIYLTRSEEEEGRGTEGQPRSCPSGGPSFTS